MKKVIELRNVSKQFDGETVLDSINLDIYDNEFLTLLGPSGCGKTTTLRMIGGFETPDQGDILFLGERINDIPPHKRNINTVFQRYALFPHLNVFENVAFPLREQKLPRNEIEQKVNEMLALVKLTGFERRNVTRHLAEPQTGYIFLLAVLCELHPAGCLPHKDRQHPGGHGVQRSAVSHPLFVEDAPHLGADVHAGPTGGLVDNQDTTGHKNLLKGSRTRPAQC